MSLKLYCTINCMLQSHPACKGPTFVRNLFNIHGQTPLVAHFLRMQNLQPEAGVNVLVQRTELKDLPPYP